LIKIIVLLSIFISSILARENPFFSMGDEAMPITSNASTKLEPLQRATITLPSTARAIERVTIQYKNLDGSQESKSINLDNSVDWHLPIFISQSYAKVTPRKNPSTSSKTLKRSNSYKKILALKSISFYENKRALKIFTHDELIRNFMLVNPHRIVMDFTSNDTIETLTKKIKNPYTYKINPIKNGYIIKLH